MDGLFNSSVQVGWGLIKVYLVFVVCFSLTDLKLYCQPIEFHAELPEVLVLPDSFVLGVRGIQNQIHI